MRSDAIKNGIEVARLERLTAFDRQVKSGCLKRCQEKVPSAGKGRYCSIDPSSANPHRNGPLPIWVGLDTAVRNGGSSEG